MTRHKCQCAAAAFKTSDGHYTITFNECKIGGGHHCRATEHIPHAVSGLLSEEPKQVRHYSMRTTFLV